MGERVPRFVCCIDTVSGVCFGVHGSPRTVGYFGGLVRVRCRVYLNLTALHMEFCVADYKGKAFFFVWPTCYLGLQTFL